MRGTTDLFQINGQPFLPPDEDVALSFEDLDSSESGRDELGFMHRVVVRYKVGTWSFEFSHITQEEYTYMLGVIPKAPSFTFTHPKQTDCTETESTTAYCSKYGIVWHSARTKDYRNFKFNIIEC